MDEITMILALVKMLRPGQCPVTLWFNVPRLLVPVEQAFDYYLVNFDVNITNPGLPTILASRRKAYVRSGGTRTATGVSVAGST
jgi:hypothetical protein